jgi:hypothetical protein
MVCLDPRVTRAVYNELRSWVLIDIPAVWLTPLAGGSPVLERVRANITEKGSFCGSWIAPANVMIVDCVRLETASGYEEDLVLNTKVFLDPGSTLTFDVPIVLRESPVHG